MRRPKSKLKDIANALLHASERAALITRACCDFGPEGPLSEDDEKEATDSFDEDFKHIVDVLAQVAAKHEIEIHCKELVGNLRGEMGTVIGEVTIELKASAEETAELLSILIPDETLALRMAQAAHHELHVDLGKVVPSDCPVINLSDVAVWMCPINATKQFLAGMSGKAEDRDRLPCVTLLLGSYLKSTGEPLFGVINQPFFYNDEELMGRMIWGLCYCRVREWGMSDPRPYLNRKIIIIGNVLEMDKACKIKIMGYDFSCVPGVGHRLMKVAIGQALAYIMAKDTFRWETCAAHSILKAKGGEILNEVTRLPLTYNDPEGLEPQAYANSDGILAFGIYSTYKKLKVVLDEQ